MKIRKSIKILLCLFLLSELNADEKIFFCAVGDMFINEKQGTLSEYIIKKRGFDINKADKVFINIDTKILTKTFVHTNDGNTILFFNGFKEPIKYSYVKNKRIYIDEHKMSSLDYIKSSTENKELGVNVLSHKHILHTEYPLKSAILFDCFPRK